MHLVELLGEWVMLNLVSIHLETVLGSVQDWCTVCGKHTMAQKSFWTLQMVLLGDEDQVQARFGLFRDSTSLIQDRCTVCVERIIGSENRFGRTRWNS